MERLASDPHYFAKPERALFQDIRRYFPITAQAAGRLGREQGRQGGGATSSRSRSSPGLLDGGVARCRATTRKGKPCQRTPLPEREYCPSHQHLETQGRGVAAACPQPFHTCVPQAPSVGCLDGVPRHRQADPAALARRLPDGGAASAHRPGREVERRGLLGDVGRGVRASLLLRPRRAALARRPAPVAARRVHRRGAVHAPLRAVLPAAARARGRGARGAPDGLLPARGQVRVRGAVAARAAEPHARPPRLRRGADRDGERVEVLDPDYSPERPAG